MKVPLAAALQGPPAESPSASPGVYRHLAGLRGWWPRPIQTLCPSRTGLGASRGAPACHMMPSVQPIAKDTGQRNMQLG